MSKYSFKLPYPNDEPYVYGLLRRMLRERDPEAYSIHFHFCPECGGKATSYLSHDDDTPAEGETELGSVQLRHFWCPKCGVHGAHKVTREAPTREDAIRSFAYSWRHLACSSAAKIDTKGGSERSMTGNNDPYSDLSSAYPPASHGSDDGALQRFPSGPQHNGKSDSVPLHGKNGSHDHTPTPTKSGSCYGTKPRKFKRRYVRRCEVCRELMRASLPSAKYCSPGCARVAYRSNRKAREAAAAAAKLAEAERVKQERAAAIERERQAKLAAEQERLKAARIRDEKRREQEKAEARQKQIDQAVPACPKCGRRRWIVERRKTVFGGTKLIMRCDFCDHKGMTTEIEPTIDPGRCPRCQSPNYRYKIDGEGKLRCEVCRSLGKEFVRSWEEWSAPKEKRSYMPSSHP